MVLAPPAFQGFGFALFVHLTLPTYLDFIPLIITTPIYLTTPTPLFYFLQAE